MNKKKIITALAKKAECKEYVVRVIIKKPKELEKKGKNIIINNGGGLKAPAPKKGRHSK